MKWNYLWNYLKKYSKLTFIIFIYLYLKKFMFEVPNTILDEVIELTETAIMEKIDSLNYYFRCVCVMTDGG